MQPEPDVSKAKELRPSVAAIIRNGDGHVLLPRRSANGLWGLPGGSVEIGESVSVAIVREVREETGLTVEVGALHAVETCFDDPRGNTLLVLYRARRAGGTPKAGDDAEEVVRVAAQAPAHADDAVRGG